MQRAGDSQHRGEVGHLAVPAEHLVIELADEARCRQPLFGGDLVEDRPIGRLEADARRMAVEAEGARHQRVGGRVLRRKDPTHLGTSLRHAGVSLASVPDCSVLLAKNATLFPGRRQSIYRDKAGPLVTLNVSGHACVDGAPYPPIRSAPAMTWEAGLPGVHSPHP